MLMEMKIIVGTLLVAEFIAGVLFNVTVLVLPEPKWTKNMKRANLLVKNLHIFDLAICVCLIPITFGVLMHSPHVNEILCFFHESFVAFATSGLCVNILFISIERYESIASSSIINAQKKTKIFMVIIWVVSIVGFCLPWFNLAVQNNAEAVDAHESNLSLVDCEHLITSYNEYNIYEVYSITMFAATFIGTVFCYVQIYRVAKKRLQIKIINSQGKNKMQQSAKQSQEKRAFKVTVSIVFCFLFCWSLFVIVSLIEMTAQPSTAVNAAHLVSLTIVFMSTIIHPILYRLIHGDIKKFFQKNQSTSGNTFTKTNAITPHAMPSTYPQNSTSADFITDFQTDNGKKLTDTNSLHPPENIRV